MVAKKAKKVHHAIIPNKYICFCHQIQDIYSMPPLARSQIDGFLEDTQTYNVTTR